MKMWDLRQPDYKTGSKCTIFDGGVTYIMQPQRSGVLIEGYSEHTIFSSSYDERIYELDRRNLKRSVKQSKKLNGIEQKYLSKSF